MICTKCGGTMSPNPKKQPGTKQPDFICDQANGECLNERGYPTAAWAKSTSPTRATAPVAPAAPTAVPASVWEAKDRLSAAQTSINASAAIYQGSGDLEAVLLAAPHLYDFLRMAKMGTLPKPVKSEAGKKIQTALNEVAKPDTEEPINVDDIPF